MKFLPKVLFTLVIVFTLFIIHNSYFLIHAEDAVPDPFVPCEEEEFEKPEFHSLRPYQASPCGDSPKAYFCDNDYIIEEEVSTLWFPGKCSESGGTYICKVDQTIERDYEITVKDAQFPILGNTQNVSNSQVAEDEFDDAQKLNEYVSWYLSGANQKAEYGDDTWDKTVNFSGPAKKLVPSVIQEWQRFATLHKAGVYLEYTDAEDMEGSPRDIDPEEAGVQVEETFNHNQIVVCTQQNFLGINIPNFVPNFIGSLRPVPCYGYNDSQTLISQILSSALGGAAGSLAGAAGSLAQDVVSGMVSAITGGLGAGSSGGGSTLRLLNWWEGKYAGLIESREVIEGWDGSQRWGSTVPPFPWQFTRDIYYQKAYNEWRGKECLIIFDRLVCADLRVDGVVDIHTNMWADFYQYIPLGTTADKAAVHYISGVNIEGLGQTTAERPVDASGNSQSGTYFIEQNPVLYYPHTQETYDIATLLNETQTPQEVFAQKEQRESNKDVRKDFEDNQCEIVDVRTNEGDDITFDQRNVELKQRAFVRDIKIHVTQIECSPALAEHFANCAIDPDDPRCLLPPACEGVVQVVIKSTPKIPFADQIYEATTVGQESAFRRIFPKVEEGAPVSCIADIPGVSEVNYIPSSQTNLVGVDTPDGRKKPDEAQLFFPHLGTVYEYFLKGIQTALRPQGYGEPIVNGELCETDDTVSCDQVAEEYGIPSCQLTGILELESSGGTNMGGESCGGVNCCRTIDSSGTQVCGPAQIKCGDVESVSGGENINVCEPCGSAELLARLMLMKVCQAKGQCNSYNWSDMKANAEKYKGDEQIDNYTAACYFYGNPAGCVPTGCTQYRWGAGKTYGDRVKSQCEKNPLPENTTYPQFCAACSLEDPSVDCGPANPAPNPNQNQQIPI